MSGAVSVDGKRYGEGVMVVFREGSPAGVHALETSRVLVLGGAPLDGEGHLVELRLQFQRTHRAREGRLAP